MLQYTYNLLQRKNSYGKNDDCKKTLQEKIPSAL